MRRLALLCLAALFGLVVAAVPAQAERSRDLLISTDLAPIAPDGLTAGAVTDFIVAFRDVDPRVAGLGLKAGGSVTITLPEEFVNEGALPVATTGAVPNCAPPLVTDCSTAVILQGWPQSVVLPFPTVTWDATTNAVTVTSLNDWLPAGPEAPGPKTVHLQLFGFTNPQRPGVYEIGVSIQPDPTSGETLTGQGHVLISNRVAPNVSSVSLANGVPPPPFPNTLYQNVAAGDPSLIMMLYLWAADRVPLVGGSFADGSARMRPITDADGRPVGRVLVKAPTGARSWSLTSTGPAVAVPAFISGYATATTSAVLHTDPSVAGTYRVTFHMFGGTSVTHQITSH